MTVRTIDEIFRDFVTDGVPASGPFNPHKPDIRDTLKALTEGSENFPDNRVIRLNNADEGTANNIVVTASVPIPAAAYQVLYILNVTQENTGPVTVSGAINRDLVTNINQPVPAGYLTPGMALLCIDTGTELRLLSYGDAEAILAAAEDAAARAEAAAASLNLPPILPGDVGKALVVNEEETGYQLIDLEVRPEMFGARGDGVTDDTNAIAQADAFCRSFSPVKRLHFGSKTYCVSQMVIQKGSNWKGDLKSTVIKQVVGANKDLLYGVNSDENWDLNSPEPTGYAWGFHIEGFTLDGSWSEGNTSGSGIAIFGSRFVLRDIYIRNCADHGMRTGFIEGNDDFAEDWYDSLYSNIKVSKVGKHGWWNNGPHDHQAINVVILDASNSGDNLYDGYLCGPRSSGRNVSLHVAHQTSTKMRYAVSIMAGASHEFSGGCNIEGARSANLNLESTNCLFDPSSRFYFPMGGVNIRLAGPNCTLNQIRGQVGGVLVGYPAATGIKYSNDPTHNIGFNIIDVGISGNEAAAIEFSSRDAGGSEINLHVYTTTGALVAGTPNPNTHIKLDANGFTGSPFKLDNWHQTTRITIPAGESNSWNFPFKFRESPVVIFSAVSPGGELDKSLWISSLNDTSVQVSNPNTSATDIFIVAQLSAQ